MGTYAISGEDLVEDLDNFLRKQEGDVSAESLAKAWNIIAKTEHWFDRLKTIKSTKGMKG